MNDAEVATFPNFDGRSPEPSDMKYKLKLDKTLRRLMDSRNLSANYVCKELDIPHSSLSDWLANRYPSARSMPNLMKLAEYFHVPLHELLFNIKDPQSDEKVIFTSEFRDRGKIYKISVETKDIN